MLLLKNERWPIPSSALKAKGKGEEKQRHECQIPHILRPVKFERKLKPRTEKVFLVFVWLPDKTFFMRTLRLRRRGEPSILQQRKPTTRSGEI